MIPLRIARTVLHKAFFRNSTDGKLFTGVEKVKRNIAAKSTYWQGTLLKISKSLTGSWLLPLGEMN